MDSEEAKKTLSAVQRGIPQGSVVSSLVAEMLLSSVSDGHLQGARIVCYADNFLVMAPEKGDAMSISQALRASLKDSPAGLLGSIARPVRHIAEEFEFLGYAFRKAGDCFSVSPTQGNLQTFADEFHKLFMNACQNSGSSATKLERIEKARSYLISWFSSFPGWKEADAKMSIGLTELKKLKQAI